MKKTLLTIFSIGAFAIGSVAQTYTPSAGSALTGGALGSIYAGQTINADIGSTVLVSGQEIVNVLPEAVENFIGSALDVSVSYTVTTTYTVLSVEGLPAGLSSDCNGCTVNAGFNRNIIISGIPAEEGNFTVNVTSQTAGEASISGITIPFGGSFSIPFFGDYDIPVLSGVFDASGYTLSITPNSIDESNDIFSLGCYPNPTEGNAILDVNSLEGGVAVVEVYSITGSQVLSFSESIRVGVNRVAVDLSGVPAGIYLIKADINGAQALIRTQKI